METPLLEKRLRVVPFALQVTRGLLRDQRARRKTMGITMIVSLVMLIAGLTVLRVWLDPHEHPWRFVLFWFACAWNTVLMVLLALLDILLIRNQARAARKVLQRQFSERNTPGSMGSQDQN